VVAKRSPEPARVERQSCLSPRERRILRAIAEAALPGGRVFPAADDVVVEKLDHFLAMSQPAVARAMRALLWTLEGAATLRHRRPLTSLPSDKRLRLIESWRHGDYARRTAIRLLLAMIKVAHFNDPGLYRHVGCVFGVDAPAKVEQPRWMERVTAAADLPARETVECDVVIIGTGAGGAPLASELAESGLAVLMLEEGQYHDRRSFTGHAIEMQRKLYRDMGATVAVGNCWIPIPIGKSVGGTTTINSGTCYRVPSRVLADWRDKFGLHDFSDDEMARHYEKVEAELRVEPARAQYLGGCARLIAKGCDALGYAHSPLRRNAPDCDGKGVCCFGCPTDAKRSTNVSYVPRALRAGANLLTGLRAEDILVENGRACGVIARARDREITVRAKAVVVSCGSLMTPVLLLRTGLANSSGQVGRNLSIHPATAAVAQFDESVRGFDAIPQGYAIEEFHDEGILYEGAFAPLDIGAASIPIIGPRFMELVEGYDRLAAFGFMIEDTSRGRVRSGAGWRPFLTYVLNDHDVARMKRGMEILVRIFLAAGAKSILPNVNGFDEISDVRGLDRFRAAKLTARDFEITAYHPLGTARMGRDPRHSVVGPTHETHDVPGLFVVDGSAVPSSLAVNPQLTIMAMATRAAPFVAQSIERA
jgi:choline dehydrogenase-like flavoprotein